MLTIISSVFLRYKLESVLFDILIEKFCLSNQVPYKPVCKMV